MSWAANWANRVVELKLEKVGSKKVSMAYVTWTSCLNSIKRSRLRSDEKLDYEIDYLVSQNSLQPPLYFKTGKRGHDEASCSKSPSRKRSKTEVLVSAVQVEPRVGPIRSCLAQASSSSSDVGSGSGKKPLVQSTLVRSVKPKGDAVKSRIARAKIVFAQRKLAQKKQSGPTIKPLSFDEYSS